MLEDGRAYAMGAAAIMVLLIVAQRRLIFSPSVLGVYCTATLIFTVVGVLVMPFVRPHLRAIFPRLLLQGLTGRDFLYAYIIVVGGLAVVLASYQAAHAISHGGRLCRQGPRLVGRVKGSVLDFSLSALVVWASLSALVTATMLFQYRSSIRLGVVEGFIAASPGAVFTVRRSIDSNYPLILMTRTILPFYCVAAWLAWRVTGWRWVRRFAIGMIAMSLVMLFSIFAKGALVAYLLMLAGLGAWGYSRRGFPRSGRQTEGFSLPTRKLALYFTGAFVVLCLFYYVSTPAARHAGKGPLSAVGTVLSISLTRLFGRLALEMPMYTHLFPDVHEHYGLTNVGLLNRLWGAEFFPDTFYVFSAFSDSPIAGSAAVPALGDFYGQFGFLGWFIGACVLGVLLQCADSILVTVRDRPSGVLLVVAGMTFAYYLTQANLPRAALGYGGVLYLLQWLSLAPGSLRAMWVRPRRPPAYRLSAARGGASSRPPA
ncbi:MAG TPA: hypothetical protein PLQ54_01120 [Armatimonadota bacterium]|nr:hypothetical protein [Armatimonadota bacterium]